MRDVFRLSTHNVVACAAALLLLFAVTSIATAQEAAPTTQASEPESAISKLPADVRELAEKFDRVWADASDMRATFTQSKHTPLLKKPLVSRGQLLMAEGMIRWDTLEPTRTLTLIEASQVSIYDPQLKRMEIYSFDAARSGMPMMAQFGSSPMPRFADLAKQFDIELIKPTDEAKDENEPPAVTLRLTPRDEATREQVEHITLQLDGEKGYLRQMRIDHEDGEYTVYTFSDVELNKGLTADDVRIKLPRGVTISRPYDEAK